MPFNILPAGAIGNSCINTAPPLKSVNNSLYLILFKSYGLKLCMLVFHKSCRGVCALLLFSTLIFTKNRNLYIVELTK